MALIENSNDMADPTELRLNEHGDRLKSHDDRLNLHGKRFDEITLILKGDKELDVPGLLGRTAAIELSLRELLQWRRDIMIYAKAGVAILAITGLGTWLPYIEQFLRFLGGN